MPQGEPATFVVALTGGIAAGKSATAERFSQHGVPVFDADQAARDVVEPGQVALTEIAAQFGRDMLDASGRLDRARMRERVFGDVASRKRLEAILHPRIRGMLLDQVRNCVAPYCVLAIPLFVESYKDYRWVDRVLVTDAPVETQFARLTRRAGIDADLAHHILSAQASRDQRLQLADDVIDNSAPIEWLSAVVERLHRRYLALALAKPRV